ncbi:TorF family putative porin [Sphingomonas sp. CJ20]
MRFSMISLGALMLASTAPAMAQEAAEAPAPTPEVTVTGNFGVTSDYRFRGLSQSHEHFAGQGTINVNHSSGAYVGTWASTIDDDYSLPGYGDAEVDLYAGFTKTLPNGLGFDVGMLYYYYAFAPQHRADGSKNTTDFFEPYASVNYTVGPVNVKVGGNYAWKQKGLADDDSLYLYSNVAVTVPKSPIPLKLLGHVGRSAGALGKFNLNAADENYLDWSLGAETSFKGFTLGVSYVDTDITNQRIAGDRFSNTKGADSTVLGYLTYAF